MLLLNIIFFHIYFFVHFVALNLGAYFNKKKKISTYAHIELSEISLVIPFRNESDRISPLIESLNKSLKLPAQIIFIDDHSSDDTMNLIENKIEIEHCHFLRLNQKEKGKKSAIDEAIRFASGKMILTLDADVSFKPTYFSNLERLTQQDLLILPVKIYSMNFIQRMLNLDTILLGRLNTGLSGFNKPIVASGANLLFNKNRYMRYSSYSKHKHILSGDDQFLLHDFKKNNCSIEVVEGPLFEVQTVSPQNIKEILNQRLRWIEKMRHIQDPFAKSWAYFETICSFSFVAIVLNLALNHQFKPLAVVLLLKTSVDLFFYSRTLLQSSKWQGIPLLFFYNFFFPIYSLFIAVGMLTAKTRWKGRRLTSLKLH